LCYYPLAKFKLVRCNVYSNDHASRSQRVHNEKTPGLPDQREPGAWSYVRMHKYNANRLKSGGTIAAQTPSASASAPHQIGTLVGADPLSVTTANQSTPTVETTKQGGGQHAPV